MSKNQKYKNKFQNYFLQVALILQKTLFFDVFCKIETINSSLYYFIKTNGRTAYPRMFERV